MAGNKLKAEMNKIETKEKYKKSIKQRVCSLRKLKISTNPYPNKLKVRERISKLTKSKWKGYWTTDAEETQRIIMT